MPPTGPVTTYVDDALEHEYGNVKVRKTAKVPNQYNQIPHLTQDTTWESDKITIRHHKPEPRGQLFPVRWPLGSNKLT